VPTLTARWAPRGQQPRIPTDSKGTRQRLTAFGLVSADATWRCLAPAPAGNRDTFLAFLTAAAPALDAQRAPDQVVLLYVDNVRFHHARTLLDPFLAARPWLRLRYLPAYSPDLNPQEDEWRGIRARVTHDTLYVDLDALWAAVRQDASQRGTLCLMI
jgi:hypothetical protein